MKTVIYYYSKSGHTKNYAESLNNRIIDSKIFFYKQMKAKQMKEYDTIIYMAPIYGNKIKYVDKFLKLYENIKDKNLIIVAVGMQMPNPERRETLIITNLLNYYHIRLYELTGGFDASKLNPFLRKMMHVGFKVAMKKNDMIKNNASTIKNFLEYPFEYNDINGIEKIMAVIHKLERESKIV